MIKYIKYIIVLSLIIGVLYYKNYNKTKISEVVKKNCILDLRRSGCSSKGIITTTVTVKEPAENTKCMYRNVEIENTIDYSQNFTSTCPVDCVAGTEYSYGSCDGTSRLRTRLNDKPALNGGKECPPINKTQYCGHCVTGTIFSSWGLCNGTFRTRVRSGDLAAFNGGNECPDTTERQTCSHCVFNWTGTSYNYSACDGSNRIRVRINDIPPVNGGNECPSTIDTQACNHCVIDWGQWGTCNATCGTTGSKSRTKKVTSIATNGGTCSVANVLDTIITPSQIDTTGCNLFSCDWIQITNSTQITIPEDAKKMDIILIGGGGGGGRPFSFILPDYFDAYGGSAGSVYTDTIILNDSVRNLNITVGNGGTSYNNGESTKLYYNGVQYAANGGNAGGKPGTVQQNIQIARNGNPGVTQITYYYTITALSGENFSYGNITAAGGSPGKYTNSQGIHASTDHIYLEAQAENGSSPGAGGGGSAFCYLGTSYPPNKTLSHTPGSGGKGRVYIKYLSS